MTAPSADVLDAVREVVNIASGSAATAMAMLVGQRIMISVPRVTLERVEYVASIIGSQAGQTVVVTMRLEGDVSGYLLFLMPLEPAHALSATLLGQPAGTLAAFDASGRSALQETANVLAGAYTGALASMIDGVIMISVPEMAIEPPDDALNRYRESAAVLSQALCIETSITIGADAAPCGAHLVLLPLDGSLVDMLRPSGV